MSGDIYVSFGAETGELEAAMARSKAEVAALARELRQTANETQESGADIDSSLGKSLSEIGQKFASDLQRPLKGRRNGRLLAWLRMLGVKFNRLIPEWRECARARSRSAPARLRGGREPGGRVASR